MKKTEGRKSRATVPLTVAVQKNYQDTIDSTECGFLETHDTFPIPNIVLRDAVPCNLFKASCCVGPPL
jgi:hypothetical protein